MVETSSDLAATTKPGRPGITFEQYEVAYHELLGADGTPPSQRQIRRYLGSGSNSTLSNYRRRMADQLVADQQPPPPHTLDATLLAAVNDLMTQLTLEAAQVAEDRVEEINKAAQSRIDKAEKIADKVQADTALLKHRAEYAEAELITARKHSVALQKRLDGSNAAISSLESEKQELTHALSNEQQTLAQYKNISQAVTQEREAAKADAAKLQKQLDKLTAAHEQQAHDLAALRKTAAQLEKEIKNRNQRIADVQDQCQQAQLECEALRQAAEDMAKQFEAKSQEALALATEVTVLKNTLVAEQRAHQLSVDSAHQRLTEKESALTHVQQALTALSAVKGELPTRQ